jgi:hypothetical protein
MSRDYGSSFIRARQVLVIPSRDWKGWPLYWVLTFDIPFKLGLYLLGL